MTNLVLNNPSAVPIIFKCGTLAEANRTTAIINSLMVYCADAYACAFPAGNDTVFSSDIANNLKFNIAIIEPNISPKNTGLLNVDVINISTIKITSNITIPFVTDLTWLSNFISNISLPSCIYY